MTLQTAAEARHRRWCNVRRVLLVRLDGVSGVLGSTASFAAIHETMPWSQSTLLTAPEAAGLRPHLQAVDDLLTFNAPWTAEGAAALAAEPATMRGDAEMHLLRKLRRSHFDAAVLFAATPGGALPAALLCRMAGIPLTLAHVREPAHGLLSDELLDDGLIQDDTRRQLALVAHVGMSTTDERPRLRLLPKDSHHMRSALQQAGLGFGQRYVLVCPGAGMAVVAAPSGRGGPRRPRPSPPRSRSCCGPGRTTPPWSCARCPVTTPRCRRCAPRCHRGGRSCRSWGPWVSWRR